MRDEVLKSVRRFYEGNAPKELEPGKDYLPAAAKSLSADDLMMTVDSVLDMWMTTGRFAKKFETDFAKFMEQKHCLLVNSGSSANLVAFATLTSELLGDRRIKKGDEVITVAAGFPTTVNPIIQFGCVPVFVDVNSDTHQIDYQLLEAALSSKTKAIMVAHTLGNPFEAIKIKAFCDKYNLWLIEDCCDAVGAKIQSRSVGTFGHLATVSFYPAHHMTMGEGGAVLTSDPMLKKIAESFRDWGRDCWCPTGKDNTCGKRFEQQFPDMPDGYDHKYIYTHVGYNLKLTDMQAALGWSQLQRLPQFIEARNKNYNYLLSRVSDLEGSLHFAKSHEQAIPSWFGFPIKLDGNASLTRKQLVSFLEKKKVGTRLLFAGNLTRQPLYRNVPTRVSGSLKATDDLMENMFWVGIHPLFNEKHLDYISDVLHEALAGGKS